MNKDERYYTATPEMLEQFATWVPEVDTQK